jgi:hypothetical protein
MRTKAGRRIGCELVTLAADLAGAGLNVRWAVARLLESFDERLWSVAF